MKLASLKHGRDGKLVVVSRDLSKMVIAGYIAPTLQIAIDDWDAKAPALKLLYDQLNAGEIEGEAFEEAKCASPLPRAYQWADGSAYVNHVELVRKARNAEMPDSFWHDPLMYQGGSDTFLGPKEDIVFPTTDGWGVDFEAEIAVITDDVPLGVSASDAASHIKLLMLVNDVSLRGLIPGELAKGFGFFQSKPSSAFSPVCVTPDELGDAWSDNKVHLPIISHYNGAVFGKPEAGIDMTFDFATLVAHAAKTRPLGAGAVVGSGTISNKLDGGPGKPVSDGGVGYSCIAEIRMIETIQNGSPLTNFMQFGDTIKIEMFDGDGQSIFGSIDQAVKQG
ncbi:fumarylacetoacetate hydrolase family protein [Kordiimonas sp. SCSIO 12610]|uniref:fumarylacetoacetate hydrolase family protein n=1 Tax=Kordiimonas sp. SCSIO 12610 TaxID=2829597 RepID=UPI00210DE21C|nr:fumarylacetoacetate hydrolase family protein [Kordiimonas sp. SCSIO 12610]UTW56795.1 fumarylacetoacetate hydrolase family protein [Kordiimonas sp. SCSIO 12610]